MGERGRVMFLELIDFFGGKSNELSPLTRSPGPNSQAAGQSGGRDDVSPGVPWPAWATRRRRGSASRAGSSTPWTAAGDPRLAWTSVTTPRSVTPGKI